MTITRLIIGIPNHLATARAVDVSSHTEAINCNLSLHLGQEPLRGEGVPRSHESPAPA